MEVSILRRQGQSLRDIAVATGTSVNTVRKYLAAGGPPRHKLRAPKPGKLDPFKDYLVNRVEAARPHSRPRCWSERSASKASLAAGGW
jgi:transposase